MLCTYSYFEENFYKRFDGTVSRTVVLIESDIKVAGSSPIKKKLFYFFFIFFCFRKDAGKFS